MDGRDVTVTPEDEARPRSFNKDRAWYSPAHIPKISECVPVSTSIIHSSSALFKSSMLA